MNKVFPLKHLMKQMLTVLLVLQATALVAQTGISRAYNTIITNPPGHSYTGAPAPGAQTSATGSNNKTYYYGNLSGNTVPPARQVQSFQTLNSTFTYNISPVLPLNVYLRRQSPPASGLYNVDLIYYEGTLNSTTTELRTNYPYFPKMEDNFVHRFMGMGTDNLFANSIGSINNNVIERVDVITQGGYTIENTLASGFAIFERGAANVHDACVIGIVMAVDVNGIPTAYAPTFIHVTNASYNTAQNVYGSDTADYFVARRNVNTSDNLLVSNIPVDQGIGGVYLNFADFGLTNNTIIHGYSIFADDFWTTTTAANRAVNALDWNNSTYFPTNTSETAGGIDLSMIAGIVKKMIITGNVYHDANGLHNNAVDGTPIYNPASEQLYVYLVNPDATTNNILAKVAVANNGTFEIDRTIFGNLKLILSADGSGTEGGTWNNTLQRLPAGWAYTGEAFGNNNAAGTGPNNGTGTGNNAPATLKDGIISIEFTDLNISAVAFGIQQTPTAQSKEYHVAADNFSAGAPGGAFPSLPNYRYIPMSSSALVDVHNSANGSMSGTDPEDCSAGTCNGNSGGISTTFTVGLINSNTRLYYDFGPGNGGVQQVIPNTATAVIPAFDISKMVIYGSNGQGTIGSELGFAYTITDRAGSSSPLASYRIQTMQALPVKFISFNVYLSKGAAILNWVTTSELNNTGFEIERSTDSKSWTSIGFVNSPRSNSHSRNTLTDYNFTDSMPGKRINYYRLKQKDLNGTTAYSLIRMINRGQQERQISIYPNPVKDQLHIYGLSGTETIRISDMTGRLLQEQQSKNALETLSVSQMHKGIFFLQIENTDGTVQSYKLLKIE